MAGAVLNRNANAISVGPGLLYVAPLGTAEPTAIDPTTWATAWIEMGYTDAGSEFQIQPSTNDINVAEETNAVAQQVGTTTSTLKTNLAQITAFNLAIAFGGGTITSGTHQSTTTLSAATTTSATTSLSVVALTKAMASGDTVSLTDGAGHTQTTTLTAAAAVGATTLAVTSFTPTVAYPIGSTVTDTTQTNTPIAFEPPAAGSQKQLMIAWASINKDEALLWRKCQPDGSLDLNRQSGTTKATIPLNLTVLAPGGSTAAWKWYGLDSTRRGPDPFLLGLTSVAET